MDNPAEAAVRAIVDSYADGIDAGAQMASRKLMAIHVAYELALKDPKALIPTYLHAAIEASRQ